MHRSSDIDKSFTRVDYAVLHTCFVVRLTDAENVLVRNQAVGL